MLGEGTGTFTILSGLKKFPVRLTAIVSMSDNGGSTGILRDELGVLPPGAVRQCLVALSEGYTASKYGRVISHYIRPARLSAALVNNTPLPDEITRRYKDMGEFLVPDDLSSEATFKICREDLITGDTLHLTPRNRARRILLRHDPEKLAQAVLRLLHFILQTVMNLVL